MTRRLTLLTMAATTAAVLAVGVPALSADTLPQNSVWNRLDMDHSNPAPEHERLGCSRGLIWTCHYDKAPEQILHVYWPVFGFTCPWYRTFSEALAASPMPLPFDGSDWPPLDCTFGP